jgi:hypothetical protein
MVCRLENLLQTLYDDFNKSPKKQLELSKLIGIMETQGNKLFKNVKKQDEEPKKKLMNEYCIPLIKMALDFVEVNFELLCDIKVLYGLIVLLTLLKEMKNLMKLAQAWNIFVANYVASIKFCQVYLFSHFVNPSITFKFNVFGGFLLCPLMWEILISKESQKLKKCFFFMSIMSLDVMTCLVIGQILSNFLID